MPEPAQTDCAPKSIRAYAGQKYSGPRLADVNPPSGPRRRPWAEVLENQTRETLARRLGMHVKLAPDWSFPNLARLASFERGGFNAYTSLAQQLHGALVALERVLLRFHSALSGEALCDFWWSEQVDEYLQQCCEELEPIVHLQRQEFVDARQQIRGMLFDYTMLVRSQPPPEVRSEVGLGAMPATKLDESAGPAVARRGYRSEIQAYMRKKGLRTNQQAAKHLGIGLDVLKNIMSGKGKSRCSADTRKTVLAKIGHPEASRS